MALKAFPAFLLASLLIMSALSSGRAAREDKNSGPSSLHNDEVVAGIYGRKVMGVEAMLDYDDACPNNKHDPRKKPGCKNP